MKQEASIRAFKIRRLITEERRLIQEKAALQVMLKNVQALRQKLKVEQIQLSSHLRAELGEDYIEVPVQSVAGPDPLNIEEEEDNLVTNKPTLDLDVNQLHKMFYPGDDEDEEDDEDDSEEEIGCAKEVMDHTAVNELDFMSY